MMIRDGGLGTAVMVPAPVSWWRRGAGIVMVGATVALGVGFALGAWNPWELVLLKYRFGNPMLGLLILPIMILLTTWVLLPVRNETRQRARIAVRVVAVSFAVLGLFAWGIFGQFYRYHLSELARTEDGTRMVVLVTNDWDNRSNMRVWDGRGLAAREVGVLGLLCGGTVRFVTNDLVEHSTGFGTWTLALDPATGEPRQVLGARCPDGPVPATLGR
jgi:hypothetical protein